MECIRSFWDIITYSVCNCLHCSEDIGTQGYEPSERTHLLSDAVNHSPTLRRTNSDNFSNEFSHSLPKRDDQNALSRLVQNTAINMIDVGAMDTHNLEHQEYTDRIKLYSQRLQQQWNNIQHPCSAPKGLLKDMPNLQFYLAQSTNNNDLIQVQKFLKNIQNALMDVKIEHKEAVVVSFRIP